MADTAPRWAFARTTAFRVTLLHLALTLAGTALVGGVAWWVTAGFAVRQAGQEVERGMGVLLQSGALEESNVDLTGELVNMIVAQRAYQANAQTIKTEDQVLQTWVNLR